MAFLSYITNLNMGASPAQADDGYRIRFALNQGAGYAEVLGSQRKEADATTSVSSSIVVVVSPGDTLKVQGSRPDGTVSADWAGGECALIIVRIGGG